jgi:O-acetyl-ADP-ribose deacetylase (regulator of RNase III)
MAEDYSGKCFVIMPFGEKLDLAGKTVRFDEIFDDFISKAIEAENLKPIRADKLEEAGFIHRKMIEHIRYCPVAVVDISLLNANVFYELGIRHTLREFVTILIRRKGTAVPFNIANLEIVEYDESDPGNLKRAKRTIRHLIANGVQSRKNDSLVHEVLDLDLGPPPMPLSRREVYRYVFKERPDKSISLITGDIRNVHGVDVWVNSENTNMQMARFYDWSISSVIRYCGAIRDIAGHVTDDVIHNQLSGIMRGRTYVPPGTVIPTESGALEQTHGVKAVFHVASVEGEVGGGYRPISNLPVCISNALTLVDSADFKNRGLKSILFPLLGAGVQKRRLPEIVAQLFEAAVSYLEAMPDSGVESVFFLVWTDLELATCQAVLEGFPELVTPGGPL